MQPKEPGVYALFDTSCGEILCNLEYSKTPMTVANFVGLTEGTIKNSAKPEGTPYYDGLSFHRVIANFMVQGGCPQGTGTGSPGYQFEDEIDPSLKHDTAGILSMANAGPGTNGSQFFITHLPTPHLDGKHTVFGKVSEGQEIVDKIATGDSIKSIRIIRVGEEAQAFKGDQAHFDELKGTLSGRATAASKQANDSAQKKVLKLFPKAEKTDSGLMYIIQQEGTGASPKSGNNVSVHYTGKLLDGQVFDSSVKRGEPIEIPIGAGRVIPGWDEGIMMMKVGGKSLIVCPPEIAYGERGAPPVIPGNAALSFEVELLEIK